VKKCTCRIRGIVELYIIKSDVYHVVDYYDHSQYLRNFKYCPLCGVKFRPIKKKRSK